MKRIFWFVLILFVVFAAGLSVIVVNAAPAGNTTLSAGQALTIKANGCVLNVKKQTASSVVVVCKASANAKNELAPDAKVTLTAGQKQKVSANDCSLSVTKKTAAVVKIKCEGSGSATPTRTKTSTQATATRTRTPMRTPTPTQPSGATYRVSIASDGTQANQETVGGDISADGRYVVFSSYANTLVSGDNNWNCDTVFGENCPDVFLHDRQTGQTTIISRASDGTQGNNSSENPSISADGRYITFQSAANNLVTQDTDLGLDIFVHDRQTGTTTLASVKSDGSHPLYSYAFNPHISADGRYVEFQTYTNELGCPTTDYFQGDFLYVHDMQTGTTTCASLTTNGDGLVAAEGYSVLAQGASISGNGRYVAFQSNANNIVSGETVFPCDLSYTQDVEHCSDVYVHDMQTGATTRVSRAPDGVNGSNSAGGGGVTALSEDGRYVMFDTDANNLVSGDTNCPNPYSPSCSDVFVYDTQTGTTTRVSKDEDGNQFNDPSYASSISDNGRYITFTGGGGFNWRAYVYDMQTGKTTQYSLGNNGDKAGANAYAAPLSADGRDALFTTKDDTMVSGDTNECYDPRGNNGWGPCLDLFVRERW